MRKIAGSTGLVTVMLALAVLGGPVGGTRASMRMSSDEHEHELHHAGGGGDVGRAAGDDPCQGDEVCSLPGLSGNPHVRMRSGYITVSEVSDRQLWFLVADREKGSQEDSEHEGVAPVLLWLTGGPGCSSLDAFIYEHGPFRFSYTGEKTPDAQQGGTSGSGKRPQDLVLTPNPYSWTKLATVIYVDSPAGVGMSYSGRPNVDYHTNDKYTIADLITFLEGLTSRYPELATAPFFISGESYGGVYVPLLATEVLRVNRIRRDAGKESLINLKGYAVGNPVTDDTIDGNAQMFFAASMGYVDPPTWRRIRSACDDMFWNATPGTDCWDAQGVVKDDLWDLNWYDVLNPCAKNDNGSSDSAAYGAGASGVRRHQRRQARVAVGNAADDDSLARRFFWPYVARMGTPEEGRQKSEDGETAQLEAGRPGGQRLWGPWLRYAVPCMDRKIALDWLNREEVRAALHAAPVSQIEWQPCSDLLYYQLDTMDLVPVHEALVQEGVRALVYSGDHDMVVPHTGTRTWVYDKAQLGRVDGPLRPWFINGQIAGFTARFSSGTGLIFATVKGAGHMVPQSYPREALHLLGAFLYDEEL